MIITTAIMNEVYCGIKDSVGDEHILVCIPVVGADGAQVWYTKWADVAVEDIKADLEGATLPDYLATLQNVDVTASDEFAKHEALENGELGLVTLFDCNELLEYYRWQAEDV